ncbi:MAG: ABC transporter permease subunit [Thermofilaceae archaeon]
MRFVKYVKSAYTIAVLTIASFLVLAPSLYVVVYVIMHAGQVVEEAFNHYIVGSGYWQLIVKALSLSLRLSLSTLALNLAMGVPLAYIISRRRIRGYEFLENVVTLALVLPTSAFGFSVLITWSSPLGVASFFNLGKGIISQEFVIPVINVPALLLITHVALSLPYLVRPLTAALETLGEAYELVSRSLGASTLTTFRRVVLPLVLPSLVSGSVLALTRSLGETGASVIVAGVNVPASVAIVRLVGVLRFGLASFLASLMVASTMALVLPIELLSKRIGLGREVKDTRVERMLVKIESKLSHGRFLTSSFKAFIVAVLFLVVLLPVLFVMKSTIEYWSRDPYTGRVEGGILYQVFGPVGYWPLIIRAALNSLVVAGLSTLIATYLSILLFTAIRGTRLVPVIRALFRIPLVVPTSATGLSALLLYGENGLRLAHPSIWLTIVVHIAFTTPVVFETLMSASESIKPETFEEVARTLGASPYDALETITLPMLKRGIVAGAVLALLSSLGETGATMMVMGSDVTLTVLVVNMAEAMAIPAALFTSTLLLAYALVALILLRRVVL